MKRFHYMLMLLALLVGQNVKAQFNPEPPDEPGARPWLLTLKAVPAEAGYFNLNQQSRHVADEVIQLTAYTNSGYRFVCWEDSLGNTLTTEKSWSYTMPQENVTLTARYEYSPNTPDEPGQASIKKRLFLKTNPADAGWFNLSSTNNISVGQTVNLHVYGNQNYTFLNWAEDGTIISSAAAFTYTMPDKDATLIANFDFDYQPSNPNEPGQPQLETCIVYAMREDAMAGQTCTFSVYFENNGSDVTGFSVDVSFPQNFSINANNVALTGNLDTHSLNVSLLDANTWHFEVRGSSVIEKGDGKALLIPVSIPSTATAGSVYTVELKNGVMVKADGGQTSIKVRNGSLRIVRAAEEKPDSPDYVVTDVQTASSDVAPGDEIQVSWKVKNQGKSTGPARWTERIYLLSSTGSKVSIGTASYDSGQLQPGEAISRSAALTLGKMPGIDGKLNIVVTITPSTSAGEATEDQQNNTTETTGSPINLSKLLYLTLPDTPQVEGSVKTIRCQLARSGDWRSNETFTVTKLKGDDRVSLPDAIFIPRDQAATYFYLPLADNDTYDTDTIVSFSIEGNGYLAVTGRLVIEDDEQPVLTITTSKSVVKEGETFQLTISTSRASATPIEVTLTSDNTKRFTYPRKAIISAGESSVTVEVTAGDDDIPSETLSNVFTASASHHNQGVVIVTLEDDDMPVLQLTLTPNKIAEGAGPVSVAGILRRTGVTSNKITVRLGDDSNGDLYFGTRELVLNKGVEEAYFNFGPIDNVLVDGDRTYTVTAAVWLSSCRCSVTSGSIGSASAQLQVLDDDGAALMLTSTLSTIREGGKTMLTVFRNTTTDQPLTVTLNSDYDTNLHYDHTIIIPAGQLSAQVEVTSLKNNISGDTHIAVFTAKADGYATGTCWLMVTDQTLPDAVVKDVSITEKEIKTAATAHISMTIANYGQVTLPAGVSIRLYVQGVEKSIGIHHTTEAVEPNESATFIVEASMPDSPGQYNFYAVVNEERAITELNYGNNTSAYISVPLLPRLSTTVSTDKKTYRQGETVVITGTATGSTTGTEVEVYAVCNGIRQTVIVTTDEHGNFDAMWQPSEGMFGHTLIGACHPDEEVKTGQTTVEIVGLKIANNGYTTCQTWVNEMYKDSIALHNPNNVTQTFSSVEVVKCPPYCSVSLHSAAIIEAGDTAFVSFTLLGEAPTVGNDWEEIVIKVSTNEGASIYHTLYYYCRPQKAVLSANESQINTTMTKGGERDYPLYIANLGKGETGRIRLSLPNVAWMKAATPTEIPSLAFGETATIVLRLKPTDALPLNVAQTGIIGVNCENGDGLAIHYSIETVSEEKGMLVVDVLDEFSGDDGKGPHLAGATVEVKHPTTEAVIAQGTTDADGKFTVELAEGCYGISVTADKHSSYTNNVLVDPGRETTHEAFLSYEAITYSWTMEETEVEDEYEITTTATFETNVPKPVLVITLPERKPGPGEVFPVTVTNHGLINTEHVDMTTVITAGFEFDILNREMLDVLGPQQSHTYYCVIRDENGLWESSCVDAYVVADGYYRCRGMRHVQTQATLYYCKRTGTTTGGGGGWPGATGPGGPTFGGFGVVTGGATGGSTPWISWPCNSCLARVKLEIKQTMTLTRPAYRGTLNLENGHETTAVTDVRLNLTITDGEGHAAGADKFVTTVESLDTFSGEQNLPGGWALGPQQTGKATVLFIPTQEAAPDGPRSYTFGGTMSCIDPYSGQELTLPLNATTFTIQPLPDLELTYLMQRDVYGDDPLTEGVVEPSVPAEFALVINNKGGGDAENVRLVTEQPRIIENEKGLLIDFSIDSTAVNGQPATLHLSNDLANDFGTIGSHRQTYAQWWLRSSLLGHFISYDVSVNHKTSYGNADLSLVSTATIHEMIHGFTPVHNSQFAIHNSQFTVHNVKRGWLVNDVEDSSDQPDAVYFADATEVPLYGATATSSALGNNTYQLAVRSSQSGWGYGSVADPTGGRLKVARVTRQSDGAELPTDNVWQTSRTLLDSREWLYEYRLHFVVQLEGDGDTLIVEFEPQDEQQEEYFYVTLADDGYATVFHSKTDLLMPSDLSASTVVGATSTVLTYQPLEGRVVPKGVPVVLESSPRRGGVFALKPIQAGAVYDGANLLHGSDTDTIMSLAANEMAYKLTYGPTDTKWDRVFGWYWGAAQGRPFPIEGHRAWLVVDTGLASPTTRAYPLEGESQGVDDVWMPLRHSGLYDLQGRRVDGRLPRKGLYIENGKKVMVK